MAGKNIVPRKDIPLQMGEVEWFLFLKMVRDAIGKELDTGNASNIRGQVDAVYRKLWEQTGGEKYSMRMRGNKVATYSVKTTHEKHKTVYDLKDGDSFGDWLFSDDGKQAAQMWADEHAEQFVKWYVERTGDIPDGVEPRDVIVSNEGDYNGGMVSQFKPQQVLKALGDDLPTAIAGLLGGDTDE